MRIRQVKSLVGGETLVEPVITKEKEILISGGTVLKPEYLDLISFWVSIPYVLKIRMKPLKQYILLSVKRENNIMSVKFKKSWKIIFTMEKFIEQNDGPCK